ncbi:MAG: transcription-repair coupling factor [Leptospiraceae bacterium]|nr:transcription-repair coupling factor [Leptospiraceae bacterium]
MKELLSHYSKKITESGFDSIYKKKGQFRFYGIPDSAVSFLASAVYESQSKKSSIIISANNTDSEILFREAMSFLPKESIAYLPGPEVIPYDYARYSRELKVDRINTLARVLNGERLLLFTSAIGFLKTLPAPKILMGKSITLKKGEEIDQADLLQSLVGLGYAREEICEEFGKFSVKGGVVDVYSPLSADPVRLDFFGDTLESIKSFDSNTQRSISELDKISILPVDEFLLSKKEWELYQKEINERGKGLKKPDLEMSHHTALEELVPVVHEPHGLLDYFKTDPVILFHRQNEVVDKVFQIEREYKSLFEKRKNDIICLPPEKLISFQKEYLTLTEKKEVSFHLIRPSELKENEIILPITETDSFKGKIRDVRDKIEAMKENSILLITSSFHAQTERLKGLFEKEKIKLLNPNSDEPELILFPTEPGAYLVLSELKNGFILPEENIHLWTENDIFGRSYKRKTKFKKTSSRAIQSFIDLREGDHVVHIHHGIGRFVKIEKVTADSKIRDFLKLEYSGGDTLFVPLDQISLVQRYVGGSDSPALDSLGRGTWKKKKERAQGIIDVLAEELLVMYSNRMKLQGYVFPKDTIWQEEFEAEFEYEETPDQLSAIEAVKADMESPRPMDRLVCGDVGYGKTEVAIRAAFKAVMAGKQVLFIAPTTILALQHFNTFSARFENYPVKIGMVSRFRTAKEVKESIAQFTRGELDLLIGTHALFSGNIKPKNLGLLIVDEEQRFGVNHKETIKKIKNLVDVLTLSATPIPRTLHMSLTGIRDLSIIETPPKNRQSVETFVLEDNEEIMKLAIEKELERGGQVFYLHNRVETIENEAKEIGKILPEISIGILHGQLSEDEVEETIMDFNNRKYDLMVTTTIIESGIDMPNVNTMIVRRADMFGLSQLYQIRGRVGRSGRKAYAYLFYPPNKSMTEQAEKRLNTISEYQELGAGFKVAMRDLEIRGAGNLLGTEQSGSIMEIGFDLYVQMLNEAVAKLKHEEIPIEVRTVVNLASSFYIPEDYIPDTKQKIEFYKRFEGALHLDEMDEIAIEMEDRFGKFPEVVETFLQLEKIRVLSSGLGFEFITEDNGEIKLKSGANFKGDPSKIMKLIVSKEGLSINPKEPSILRFKLKSQNERARLREVISLLQKLS